MRVSSHRQLAAAAIFSLVGMAYAQSLPPLLPGELYSTTQNGCGVILTARDAQPSDSGFEKAKQMMGEMVWTGSCPNGLADGTGALGKPSDLKQLPGFKQEFRYGRMLGKSVIPNPAAGVTTTYYNLNGKSVGLPNLANPYAPRWSADFKNSFLRDADGNSVRTEQSGCFIDQDAFRGCDTNNDFQVYGVAVTTKSDPKGVTSWCPNPRTPNGCEALWQEKAGPIIASIKAFVAEAEKAIAEDKRKYAELVEPWIEREAQKKLANEAEAKRLAAAKASALEKEQTAKAIARAKDREIAAAEQRERDEFDIKEKQKAEQAFQASLKKLNAGELYALADKKRSEGEPDKAREILRTLITKFPNNALVAVAAQQMSQLPQPAPAAAPPAAPVKSPAPVPAATNKAAGRDAGLEEMAGVFGRPAK